MNTDIFSTPNYTTSIPVQYTFLAEMTSTARSACVAPLIMLGTKLLWPGASRMVKCLWLFFILTYDPLWGGPRNSMNAYIFSTPNYTTSIPVQYTFLAEMTSTARSACVAPLIMLGTKLLWPGAFRMVKCMWRFFILTYNHYREDPVTA
jgi:hypothetical protein